MLSESGYRILVVEDDPYYKKLLEYDLQTNPDFQVKVCSSGKECMEMMKWNPNIITLDYRLPDMDGMQIFKKIRAVNEEVKVIIVSSQEDIEVAVELLKEGAYDYIVKAKDIRQRLLRSVNAAVKEINLQSEIIELKKEIAHKYDFQKSIIGKSKALESVFELIEKASNANIVVSIQGETGTGKELVAKAIHYNSKRKDKKLVAINIAAIPSELLESELFGYEKGAFTGANQRKLGKFEEANGGTLFLDEIGEMDINLQAKLLRALQEKEVVRLGNNTPVKFDARILVATHKDLKAMVAEGKFREDLYYRLFGLTITLPPLRDRGNDILLLADYFLKSFVKENDSEAKQISEEAKNKLLSYHYPGNIRELKSVIDLAAVLSNGNVIEGSDIQFQNFKGSQDLWEEEMTMKDFNLKILEIYLRKYNNNIPLVAEKLEISQATIYRMIKRME